MFEVLSVSVMPTVGFMSGNTGFGIKQQVYHTFPSLYSCEYILQY